MNENQLYSHFDDLLSNHRNILIIQADNPDADSLGSAIALEQLLMEMGKNSFLYCAVTMPDYLKYVRGWDRVSDVLFDQFDMTIFVDVSTTTLIKKIIDLNHLNRIKDKPVVVIDHHATVNQKLDFAALSIVLEDKASTGQIIFELAKQNSYKTNNLFLESVLISILGDTQGLSNQLALPETYRIVADIIDLGVNRSDIDERRREYSSYPVSVFNYKADLIRRTEFYKNNEIGVLILNQDDITKFSPLYNQGPLMHPEILGISGVKTSIVLKVYQDGHLTGSIRCNNKYPVASKLADIFDGGGHEYASGFNIKPVSFSDFKDKLILKTSQLLDNL